MVPSHHRHDLILVPEPTPSGQQCTYIIEWNRLFFSSLLFTQRICLVQYFFLTCEFYWGDVTFAEAFEKTGKHVCIHVSASRASSGSAQRLLLNHISTPHVTLASAVAASCALPGVMKPRKLQAKNSIGAIEDFEVDGVEWIDGSVQADIPFQVQCRACTVCLCSIDLCP